MGDRGEGKDMDIFILRMGGDVFIFKDIESDKMEKHFHRWESLGFLIRESVWKNAVASVTV